MPFHSQVIMHCLPSNLEVLVVRMNSRRVHEAFTPGDTGGVSDQNLVKVSSGLQQSCFPIDVVYPWTALTEAS